jgi:hypothetical protein
LTLREIFFGELNLRFSCFLRILEANCVEIFNKYDEKKVSDCAEFLDKIIGKNDKKYNNKNEPHILKLD